MAKREKKNSGGGGEEVPAWMITFSDLMTLLLTFFVLLLSMASMTDVSKRKVALGSVSGYFGTGAPRLDDLTTKRDKLVDPGPLNEVADLEPIKKRVLEEDPDSDLKFEYNHYLQRVTLDSAVLFRGASAELTDRGRELLASLVPALKKSTYPLGLTGHTAGGMDEFGPDYMPDETTKVDFSWRLSLDRVVAVYRFFVDAGIEADKLRLEAYGRYRPKTGSGTRKAREGNRRVEIILDRRIQSWEPTLVQAVTDMQNQKSNVDNNTINIRDFLFRFDMPGGEK